MGTPHFHTLPPSVRAPLLAAALRADLMGSTFLRRPFDDGDYVPAPMRRPVGSGVSKSTDALEAARRPSPVLKRAGSRAFAALQALAPADHVRGAHD